MAVDRRDRDVDDHQVLDELRAAGEQRALGVDDERSAVEHELVLAADLVDVHDRGVCVLGAGGDHPFPPGVLLPVVRRAVDVDAELGTAGGLCGERPERRPDVLADRDPDLGSGDHVQRERLVVAPGRERARLVEHGVVGKQPLVVRADHVTVHAHRGGVVDVAVGVDETDHGRALAGVGGEAFERGPVVGDEARLEHEIFRRVPGDRQLGKGDDVAARRVRLGRRRRSTWRRCRRGRPRSG